METPMVDGALAAVDAAVGLFQYRVHIVSKAGPKIAALTRQWLGLHGFVSDEAIPPGNVHFVRKRPDKHPVCEQLGVTHFIDDRLDVLQHLSTVDHRYLFVGGLGRHEQPREIPSEIILVETWTRLVSLLTRDLEDGPLP